MRAQPFRPFRVCLSDGKTFDIPNDGAAFLKEGVIEIGVELNAEGFAIQCVECAILHITRIEDLPTAKAA
jgi:hypothetical protein